MRPAEPYSQDPALSDRPDVAARTAFLREHLLIHTHTPKTAGSAVSAGLSAIVGGVHTLDTRFKRATPIGDLTDAERDEIFFVSGHFRYGIHTAFDRVPLYLAAIRSPVDRVVSMYRYMQDAPEDEQDLSVTKLDFDEAWRVMDENGGPDRRDLQARYLTGKKDGPLDEDFLWHQADIGYFLLIPQDRVSEAIHRLRAAFGVAWTKVSRVNPSRSAPVEPSKDSSTAIRERNPLDQALFDHVAARFDDNLNRACAYIAKRCLAKRCLRPLNAH
ncbi:MAG: hypothetical protein AAF666_11625 [Pseudomonadota bacterium]